MTPEQINVEISEVVGKKRDYYHCLNAMHAAEQVLIDAGKAMGYGQNLWRVHGAGLMMWNATAAQRAEAFLRTLGLWKDTPVQQREKTSSGIAAAHQK